MYNGDLAELLIEILKSKDIEETRAKWSTNDIRAALDKFKKETISATLKKIRDDAYRGVGNRR